MSTTSFNPVVGYLRRLGERDARGLTDRQLLDRFTRDRDEAAFTELVRRHGPMVLSACRRVLRHEQDAEDAFQASFLVLARKAGSVRQRDSVGGWLYQVAYRLALRVRADTSRRREQCPLSGNEPGRDPSQESLRSLLDEELRRLPEPYRAAVVLCYLEGRTQAEAAGLLATTADAVNSRLKRARDLLRHRLARRGLLLSGVAVAEALSGGTAQAALPPALLRRTARTAIDFATGRVAADGASAFAADLARGALHNMLAPKIKLFSALALVLFLLTGGMFLPPPALGDPSAQAVRNDQARAAPAPQGDAKARPRYSVILLWMNGGPSQIDTFDLKPGHANGGPFKEIETTARGVKISEHLPRLARQAKHLAIIRSMTTTEGDHVRGTYLMRTGRPVDDGDYPTLGSALAKELGEGREDLPGYISLAPWLLFGTKGFGPVFLDGKFSPLLIDPVGPGFRRPDDILRLPPEEAFEELQKGKGKKLREAVAKAFDLSEEKEAVRDAYGPTPFGQGCLLARRLVERGVPVVEVTLPGWDSHQDNVSVVDKLSNILDRAWGALLQDLHELKKLDTTLIVWMGEFGRTPRINPRQGRDHFPICFTAVLAGAKIKGGQAIGKTSADGIKIVERPVTPAELHATIYRAVGIDPTRENRAPDGEKVPLVEKGTKAVNEALR
jgi:RNA polymerase sigma factor (sigma-70 family)